MFDNFFGVKVPESISLEKIKEITSVLIIDDEEPAELRLLLKKSGWKNSYVKDLDSLETRKLKDSQIVCIDIMGVGKTLQVNNGMGLVKDIKLKFPEKKIILYSSVSNQDIFSEALDYVDKRLRKQSSLIPFVKAIEEMATSTFSWDETLRYTYLRLENEIGDLMDFDSFKKNAEKSIRKGGLNTDIFVRKANVSLDVASKIASLVALALAA